jgi:hypothetical protein
MARIGLPAGLEGEADLVADRARLGGRLARFAAHGLRRDDGASVRLKLIGNEKALY